MRLPHLDADEIFGAVDVETGLGRFADDGLKARLRALVDKFNAEAAFTPDNLPLARAQVAATLRARLKLARDWQAHPEILQEKIERPIFIVGYGRTGTTITHCLLGEDPANRVVTWAESMHPSPPPGSDPAGAVRRAVEGLTDLAAWLTKAPGLLCPHPYIDYGLQSVVECEELFAIDFLNDYPSRYFNVPIAPIDTTAVDPLAAYRFEKALLQQLQWRQPAKRWVLKGVFHQFVLDSLLAVFPDACCVWTHRNPLDVVPSILSIYASIYDDIAPGYDHEGHARRMIHSLKAGYDHVMASGFINDPRVFHLRFKDFMADHVGSIRKVYGFFDIPFTDEHADRIRAWLAHPRNKPDRYGKFTYSFEEHGIERDEVASLFSDYTRHFDLA